MTARQREHSALPVQAGGGREIRQLAETFNLLTDERQKALDDLAERQVFFRSLSESAPIGIVQTDVLGRIEFTNPAFQTIMGRSTASFRGWHLIDGVYKDDRQAVLTAWRGVLYDGKVYQGQYRLHDRQANRIVWVRTMIRLIETASCVMGSVSVIRDITHELEVERELEVTRTRADGILGVLQEAVILTDRYGVIEFANAPANVFLNAPDSVVGQKLFDQISIRTPTAPITLNDMVQQSHVDSLDVVLIRADGTELDIELTMLRLEPGQAAEQFVFVLRDDSEKRRHEQQLSWEATHDSLTGLANRRAFADRLSDLFNIAPSARPSSALLMIDLDYFKPVSDTGGHLVGDELLRALATALLAGVRQTDFIARLGGDEFAIILPGCSMERALIIAESLRAGVAGVVIEENGQQYSVTASIGVTAVTAEDANPKTAIARADEATYLAKAEIAWSGVGLYKRVL